MTPNGHPEIYTSLTDAPRKTVRHRLNRGGDRVANSAWHIIAIGRLRTDERTKVCVTALLKDIPSSRIFAP